MDLKKARGQMVSGNVHLLFAREQNSYFLGLHNYDYHCPENLCAGIGFQATKLANNLKSARKWFENCPLGTTEAFARTPFFV